MSDTDARVVTRWEDRSASGETGYAIVLEPVLGGDWYASLVNLPRMTVGGHGATREEALYHLCCSLALIIETPDGHLR